MLLLKKESRESDNDERVLILMSFLNPVSSSSPDESTRIWVRKIKLSSPISIWPLTCPTRIRAAQREGDKWHLHRHRPQGRRRSLPRPCCAVCPSQRIPSDRRTRTCQAIPLLLQKEDIHLRGTFETSITIYFIWQYVNYLWTPFIQCFLIHVLERIYRLKYRLIFRLIYTLVSPLLLRVTSPLLVCWFVLRNSSVYS